MSRDCPTCGSSGMPEFYTLYVCKVCALIDKDFSKKKTAWCADCANYICQRCWPDKIRRGHAAVKEAFRESLKWFKQGIIK